MSADNWTFCPKCNAKAAKARQALEKKVKDSYGKIPEEEYLQLKEKLKKKEEPVTTLREDYELGIRDGKFFVSYGASCSECNYSFHFKEERQLDIIK
jgi:hypothetical protein